MIRWFGPVLLAIAIFGAVSAWAQTDAGTADTGVPTQPGPKPAFVYPDATPSLDFLSQSVENSSITLGINAGISFDSNAFSVTSRSQKWWLLNVSPSIRIQQFRPRLAWHLAYSGGYQDRLQTNGQVNPNSNLFAQNASAGFMWQLARRWQLVASDRFTYSANPFESYVTNPGTPTLNNPNPITYFPLTQYTQNYGLLSLTDQLGKRDTLSFSGTANLRRTSTYNVLTTVPFYNLVSYGGRASYNHQLSSRLSLGADYNYNSLDFGRGQQRSGIQTILMTVDYRIRPNMTIAAWVGPEYTTTKTIVPIFDPFIGQIVFFTTHNAQWNTSLGANFGWSRRRDSIRAGFSRQVSDGGGIIATSQVNAVNGSYRRMFTPKLDLVVGAQDYHDVSTTVSSRSFNNLTFNAGLTYILARSLNLQAQYMRVHQTQSNTILIGSGGYDANIVGASISYSWNHPLGR